MIDSHSHISHLDLDAIELYFTKFEATVVGGYDKFDWLRQLDLKKVYPKKLYISAGIHPWLIKEDKSELVDWLRYLKANISRFDAIGETGLDYSKNLIQFKDLQKKYFIKHIDLATSHNKPLILHVVRSNKDVIDLLPNNHTGMVHSFQGSINEMFNFVEKGFYISLGPSVLKNKDISKLTDLVLNIPEDKLLLESDYPGQKSDLTTLTSIYDLVADIKKTDILELKKCQFNNFYKFLTNIK